MTKIKKVSADAFEKAVKNNHPNIFTANWNGLEVLVSYTVGMQDVFNIVEEVVTNSFSETGEYIPEATDAVLANAIISRYTNITMPENIEVAYQLVMQSGLLDFVLSKVNTVQYEQIVSAIENKIDYICDSNVSEMSRITAELATAVSGIKSKFDDFLGAVDQNDFESAIQLMSSGKLPDAVAAEMLVEEK